MSLLMKSIKDVSLSTFVKTFNAAYADYYIDIEMDQKRMRSLFERDAIDDAASRIVFDDEQPVGVGMLAVQNGRGWIGGLGVIPAYRGRGLGRALMEELLAEARTHHLAYVDLEVLTQNIRAHSLYLSLGFRQLRRLLVLEHENHAPTPAVSSPFTIEVVTVEECLAYYNTFHPSPNPWQRRYEALTGLEMEAWLIKDRAYCMGWALEDMIRLMDVGIAVGEESALVALLQHIHAIEPAATASIINVPEDDPTTQILLNVGYKVTASQFEMRHDLK